MKRAKARRCNKREKKHIGINFAKQSIPRSLKCDSAQRVPTVMDPTTKQFLSTPTEIFNFLAMVSQRLAVMRVTQHSF